MTAFSISERIAQIVGFSSLPLKKATAKKRGVIVHLSATDRIVHLLHPGRCCNLFRHPHQDEHNWHVGIFLTDWTFIGTFSVTRDALVFDRRPECDN